MDTIYLLPGEERCIDFRDANGVDVAVIRLDPQILFTVLRAHQLQQKTLRIPTPSEFAGSISSYLCAQRLVETTFRFLRLQTGFFSKAVRITSRSFGDGAFCIRVTKFCAAPAQGRRSRWAWTKSRSCRFPGRCGGPRQRRWPSWQ